MLPRFVRNYRAIGVMAARFLAVLALMVTAVPTAKAQTNYFWDIDGAIPGAGGATPSGTWSTLGTTWSTNSNGSIATPAYTTMLTDNLFFSAGTNATGTYTITLNDVQNAGSLAFQEGTATISGASGVITLGAAGGNITVNNGATGIIGANTDTIIAGIVGLTKSGVGTLTLSGTTSNTFTGGLNINGGTLALNFANMLTPTDLINNGNTLSFGGGFMAITSKGAGSTTNQTFGNVTLNSGGGSLLVNPNGGTDTNITLGTLTTTASGGALAIGRALSSGTGTLTITTTTNVDATGIYGGRVVFADGAATGYNWANNAGGGGPFTLTAYAGYAALDLTAGTDANNSRITAGVTMTGSRETNSLKFENPLTAQTLTIGAGNTLTLSSGGLLFTGASVAQGPRIALGSLTVGNSSGSYDLVVHSYNATAQNIVIGVTGTNLALVTTISSVIADNGANPVTFVKNGPGSLVLSGANTFTGGIVVNGGNLAFNVATAINNNAMIYNANSTIHTFGGSTTTGQITLNNNSQLTILNNNSSFTVTGAVTGTGGISVAQGGQGAITLNLNATNNSFTGPIRFASTQNNQNATINVNSLADTSTFGEGNITLGFATGAGTNTHIFGYTGTTAALTLNNRRFELATNQIFQTINMSGSQPFTINSDLLVTGTNGKPLTFGGAGTGIGTFAGVIANNANPTTGSTFAAATYAIGSTTITLASVTGISPGATITGTGITAGTTITAINPITRVVTLSLATTTTAGTIGANLTITGVTNSVSIIKSGVAPWVLSGNNTYTGGTNVTAGILNIQNANALGATAFGTQVANGATLQLQGGISYAAEPLTLIPGTGGTAMLLNVSSNNTWNGTILSNTATNTNVTRVQSDLDTLTLAGLITVSGSAHQFVLQGNADITVTGQITGVGRLTSGSSGTGIRTVNNDANNYTGVTNVNGGTLAFTSIENVGAASSALGAPADVTAGTIPVAAAAVPGTFRYIGTLVGGHTSDRIINLAAVTATATIEANGVGPLVFTSNLTATGAGIKTLALTGTNTGNNTIGGTIIDNSALNTTALQKNGVGTWLLSGASTYSGGTTLNQGVLTFGMIGTPGATTGALAVNNNNSTAAGTNAILNLATAVDTTVGSLSGTIATPPSGTNTATINNGGIGRIFTVNQTVSGAFPGVMAGAGSFTLGSLSTNTLVLTGANTYSGGTVITAGTVAADTASPNSATGTAAVTVTAGTLRGIGNIAGAITLNGGTIAPGDATNSGVLTTALQPIFMTGGMTFNVSGGLVNSSQLNITAAGTLALGTALTLSVTPYTGGTNPDHFTLIASGGSSVTGEFAGFPQGTILFSNLGTDFAIHYGSLNSEVGVFLTSAVIPEPTALGIAVIAGFGVVLRRRRTPLVHPIG